MCNSADIKVSVVMPIYNAYDYLHPAMDSVIDQTLREIEIICIDDGSTDHSLEIIKEYQKLDERIRIITENNAGAGAARNKGLARARGEYVIFLDADDFYEPTLLERLYERAEQDQLDIAVVGFDIYNSKRARFEPSADEEHGRIFENGAVVSKSEFPDSILQSTTGYVWNKLFRTSFVREKELAFAPELYVFEDVYFVCTALSLAGRVGRIYETLVHHRVYSDQSRQKLFRKYYHQVPVVYLKVKEFLMQHGMYIPLMRSFLNFSANRCYKIYNLLWSDAKVQFWDMLHDGYADSLGWYKHPADDFESDVECDFVANIGLYTHKQFMKREDKGRHLNGEKLFDAGFEKRLKTKKKNERIRGFFAAIGRFFAMIGLAFVKPFKRRKTEEK